VKRAMQAVSTETAVRVNVRQLIGLAIFIAANTGAITLWFDRRMAANEHATERQGDRLAIVERSQEALSTEVTLQIEKQNVKLDRLTDAINSLAVNIAKLGVTTK